MTSEETTEYKPGEPYKLEEGPSQALDTLPEPTEERPSLYVRLKTRFWRWWRETFWDKCVFCQEPVRPEEDLCCLVCHVRVGAAVIASVNYRRLVLAAERLGKKMVAVGAATAQFGQALELVKSNMPDLQAELDVTDGPIRQQATDGSD